MDRNYGGIIWTNHALSRMREREIKQGDAWVTWKKPDSSRYNSRKGVWVYIKTYGNEIIEVVAKKKESKEWIILSVWSKKVLLRKKEAKSFTKSIFEKLFGKK